MAAAFAEIAIGLSRRRFVLYARRVTQMGFLLDTNILSDLARHPRGRIADRIAEVGEQHVCTSIVVAAELRYGAARKASSRLSAQLEAVLGAAEVLALESPVDTIYGEARARLERAGQNIGANDLLIAAHAFALDHTVVTPITSGNSHGSPIFGSRTGCGEGRLTWQASLAFGPEAGMKSAASFSPVAGSSRSRVRFQNLRAALTGSIPASFHQAASFPTRCTNR
jgi:tRNA(fMet)-specific endonuclease VapC